MSKSVEQIKSDKSEVEGKILKMLKDLEISSAMSINYVEVRVDRHDYEEKEKVKGERKKLRKLKGILDVMIQMEIGNDPDSVDTASVRG